MEIPRFLITAKTSLAFSSENQKAYGCNHRLKACDTQSLAKVKPTLVYHKRMSGRGWICTIEGRSQQIYSLSRLSTSVPFRVPGFPLPGLLDPHRCASSCSHRERSAYLRVRPGPCVLTTLTVLPMSLSHRSFCASMTDTPQAL